MLTGQKKAALSAQKPPFLSVRIVGISYRAATGRIIRQTFTDAPIRLSPTYTVGSITVMTFARPLHKVTYGFEVHKLNLFRARRITGDSMEGGEHCHTVPQLNTLAAVKPYERSMSGEAAVVVATGTSITPPIGCWMAEKYFYFAGNGSKVDFRSAGEDNPRSEGRRENRKEKLNEDNIVPSSWSVPTGHTRRQIFSASFNQGRISPTKLEAASMFEVRTMIGREVGKKRTPPYSSFLEQEVISSLGANLFLSEGEAMWRPSITLVPHHQARNAASKGIEPSFHLPKDKIPPAKDHRHNQSQERRSRDRGCHPHRPHIFSGKIHWPICWLLDPRATRSSDGWLGDVAKDNASKQRRFT
ncbi:hypothetical protein BDN72DRAFT_856433 [Pluteus cervinus]|uniref:Uncharacterized protein n=1 Tax=Pluteus cervinus TaxID=181527 RepID=A0ACD3B009_9AGAR|nr:hypothetical protein BDN72DRAFT_856433 [Pluteus cervinus]